MPVRKRAQRIAPTDPERERLLADLQAADAGMLQAVKAYIEVIDGRVSLNWLGTHTEVAIIRGVMADYRRDVTEHQHVTARKAKAARRAQEREEADDAEFLLMVA